MAEKPTYKELEKRVRELEQMVRDHEVILDSLPDHVTVQIPDHIILWANAAACRTLGRDRADILNRSCREVWAMDDVLCGDCAMPESVENGTSGTMEKTTPDGRTWRVRFVPMRDGRGEVSRILEIREEITEIVRCREARREAERHRRLILDTMREMLAYHDTELRVQWANRASAESVGETVEDLVGRHCYEIWHHHDRPCEGCPVLGAIHTRRPREGEMMAPDGRLYHLRAYPVFDNNGALIGAVEYGADITEAKAAERALRVSEEKFRKAFDTDIVAMAVSRRRDGMYLEANPGFQKLTGYTHDEIIGHTPMELGFYSPEERVALIKEIAENGHLDRRELTFLTKSEGLKTILFSIAPIVLDNEDCFLATMVDITERKKAEEALHASEKLIKSIINATQDVIVSKDADFKFRVVNPAMCKLTGRSEADLLGKTDFDVFSREQAERFRADDRVVLETSRSVALEEWVNSVDGPRWVSTTKSPLLNEHGERTGVVAVVRDRTEQRQAEEALKREKERLNDILQGTRAGTWEWFVRTGETLFNDRWAEIVGYTLAELQPVSIRTWMDLCHPEDLKRSEALLQAHFSGASEYYEFEARMRHKEGHWVWVQDRGKVVEWTADGRPKRMTGTHIDVTERKQLEAKHRQLEQRLQQIQKAESLARMAGAVAHHFNNMLAVILGNLELAKDELLPEERAFNNITAADKAARRAVEISHRMLTYLGQDLAPRHPLDLSAACRCGLESRQGEIRAGRRLKQDLPEPGPAITATPAQVEQVLDALVENAWEALAETPEGGITVSVGVADPADIGKDHRFPADWEGEDPFYACLAVADTGKGMDGKTIDAVFDPFFTDKFTGRGLGLAVVLGIVKAHGGCITVDSTPGRGSVFRVFLPLAPESSISG